ncbi:hypothetical protein [Thalassobellus suaedae]|uniref:GIY-YIG homing endonuclease n=1 Tax=Thalassobellus suaedae TaxID=3074124 RepID=A0ABY9XRK6_9FLAO|nr:hypothetical protein RHP51_15485 [Flavobacteriaceae bacterium HL-DH14]
MISVEKLNETTNEFFNAYCKTGLFDSETIWSPKWNFKGELHNNSRKGCYAHLADNEVVYIGLAIGNSLDGSGIGARVSKYWKKDKDYSSTNQAYTSTVEGVTAIITLPFSEENFYLAAALEVYLIQNLDGLRNKAYSRKN